MRLPKKSILAACDEAARRNEIIRIAGIRARLADGWRHMDWEARLEERERGLRNAESEVSE